MRARPRPSDPEISNGLLRFNDINLFRVIQVDVVGGVDSDDAEVVTSDRMTEEELLKGLEGLAPPEEVPEEDAE